MIKSRIQEHEHEGHKLYFLPDLNFPVPVLADSLNALPLAKAIQGEARESTQGPSEATPINGGISDSRGGETICDNCGCLLINCVGNCIYD